MTTFQLPVLLITSSIRVSAPLTALTDPAVRLAHTLDALRLWVAAYPTLQVVVCDGSNFDLTAAVQQQMPQASVECLSFENDQEQVARTAPICNPAGCQSLCKVHVQVVRQKSASLP